MRGRLGLAGGRIQGVGILQLLDVLLAHHSMIHHWLGVVHPYAALGLLLICIRRLPGLVYPFDGKILQAQAMPLRNVAENAGTRAFGALACSHNHCIIVITQVWVWNLELNPRPRLQAVTNPWNRSRMWVSISVLGEHEQCTAVQEGEVTFSNLNKASGFIQGQ